MSRRSEQETRRLALSLRLFALSMVLIFSAVIGVESQDKVPSANPTSSRSGNTNRPTGSIDGQVTDDSGKPMADVMVSIGKLGEDQSPTSVLTDADGRFQAKNLASGVYRVGARSPGFVLSNDSFLGTDGLLRFYRPGESANLSLVKGGVITGTITDASGNPVVGVNVTAISLAGTDDQAGAMGVAFGTTRPTDDRGIYRIYGLRGGRYMVYAGAGRSYSFRSTPYDRDAPTYYPSSTRDTASILNVQVGQELTGIDIRYRGDMGYSITGTVTGSAAKFAQFALLTPGNLTPVGTSFSQEQEGRMSFSISNLTNGDYKIVGYSRDEKSRQGSTGTVTVSVRNADATGVVMRFSPLASIAGHYVLTDQPNLKCETKNSRSLDQIVVASQPEKRLTDNPFVSYQNQVSVGSNDEFQINDLLNGNYRLRTFLPSDDWYLSTITRPSARTQPETQAAKSPASPPELIVLANGASMSNLTINLSMGGGTIGGQVVGPQNIPAATIPDRLYLVPTEKERADDTLRFSESAVASDGTFSFRNLAPGNYFLLSKPDEAGSDAAFRPVAWDPARRAALLRASAGSGFAVEIKPCQRITDLQLVAGADGSVKAK